MTRGTASCRADKKLFIAEHTQLTGSEAKAFGPIYESYEQELSTLNGAVSYELTAEMPRGK